MSKLETQFEAFGLEKVPAYIISLVIITIILSYFTLVFGELVPKRIAMKNYEKIAYGSIGVIRAISIVTSPFVRFVTFCFNLFKVPKCNIII